MDARGRIAAKLEDLLTAKKVEVELLQLIEGKYLQGARGAGPYRLVENATQSTKRRI